MTSPIREPMSQRCDWCGIDPLYVDYHDRVWGRPEYDDQALFEKLCLDGQQAGLSWITILRKQGSYEAAFDQFDADKIARYDQDRINTLMQNRGIIRSRLKIESIIRNARSFLQFREQGESFSRFLWDFVDGHPRQNAPRTLADIPAVTPESEAMSKALKQRGFNFVGPTIVYAFMQATGMVNDHLVHCPAREPCQLLASQDRR